MHFTRGNWKKKGLNISKFFYQFVKIKLITYIKTLYDCYANRREI